MKPAPFAYHRPATLDEVLDLLAGHGPEAAVLAGGQSLVPLLNLRLARPSVVVDLGSVFELDGVLPGADTVRLGPLVRQAAVLADPAVAAALPLAALALPHVGHAQTRSLGTVCGSVAHADPMAEVVLASLVAGASVELTSAATGTRRVALDAFLDTAFAPRRRSDELVTALTVDRPRPGSGHGFSELTDGVTVGSAAVSLAPLGDGRWSIRLGLGLDRDRPLVAEAVHHQPEEAVAELAATLAARAEPFEDRHGGGRYRRSLAATLAHRALRQALRQALGRALGQVAEPAGGQALAAATAVPAGPVPLAPAAEPVGAEAEVEVTLLVDGRARTARCEARTSLADFTRDELGLSAVHLGCEQGVCGSCTVLLDGAPVRACLVLAVAGDGRSVTTAAGLDGAGFPAAPLAAALAGHFALQCGFCAPGLMVSAAAWLATGPAAEEGAVRQALSGTICRCSGYDAMVRALLQLAGTVQQ